MSNDSIKLHDVSRYYRKGGEILHVLNKLSMEIKEGEFIAIMGVSGSGKTTLLNSIGGLDKPDKGYVEVLGQNLSSLNGERLTEWRSNNIGYVFQQNYLIPILSTAKNVEVPLLLTSLTKSQRKQRVQAALSLVGLENRDNHKPRELSGGQEQRVGIARAIVKNPNILLCDEPTGNLDASSSEQILNLLQILNQEHNKTIFMVTHDPKAAEIANLSYTIKNGQLEQGML